MCGIAGLVNFSDKVVERGELDALNNAIAHRGPDDCGVYIDQNLGFGHRRLSIIDVSCNGHQPMQSSDGRFILIFNGEIYNHQVIRRALEQKGYRFQSTSDTETLLQAYIEYGDKVVTQLNGIFSFAIYDRGNEELFLARDHFGIKPLYFSVFDGKFVFSSELKSFIKFPHFNKEVDYQALLSYVNFLWCPGIKTPFAKVNKLQPGHYLKFSTKRFSFSSTEDVSKASISYYDIPFNGTFKFHTQQELKFLLDYKLNKAVERQLMSDVPLGFFLSGGLDSSLVAAIAQRHNGGEKLNAFTIDSGSDLQKEGFPSDLKYAQRLAEMFKFNLNVVPARTNILDDFDMMIWHLDEPQADPAPLNVYQISLAAKKQGIKVLLGGVGGDDLFSGYRRHQAVYYNKLIDRIPGPLVKALKNMSDRITSSNSVNRRIQKILKDYKRDEINQLTGYFSWIKLTTSKALFSKDIAQMIDDYDPADFLKTQLNNIPKEQNNLNKLLYLEMKSFLPDHNLNYTDKMSMAAGVEARVPYLDLDLVNFSAQIDPKFKLHGSTTKYILKKVAEDYLPKDIIYRRKAGFGAPVRKWISHDMKDMIAERLSTEAIDKRGLFNPKAVHALIEGNRSGKFDASYIIWSLLAIESWMKQFVDTPI